MHGFDAALVETLLQAYSSGAFPMADAHTGDIAFYTADPRVLVPLDDSFHVPRTVQRDIRRGRFTFRTDTAFSAVVAGCAAPRKGARPEDAWLDPTIAAWAAALHDAGYAHSLEAWTITDEGDEALVGGIYGVAIGSAFMGESMFHRARTRLPDGSRHPHDGAGASSACLVTLQRHLRACGFSLFDAQIPNPHTSRFSLFPLSLDEYNRLLDQAVRRPAAWRPLPGAERRPPQQPRE